jgi:hypothetical protein
MTNKGPFLRNAIRRVSKSYGAQSRPNEWDPPDDRPRNAENPKAGETAERYHVPAIHMSVENQDDPEADTESGPLPGAGPETQVSVVHHQMKNKRTFPNLLLDRLLYSRVSFVRITK